MRQPVWRVRRNPLADEPAERHAHPGDAIDLDAIEQGKRITSEQLDGVLATRRVGGAVAASVVAQDAEAPQQRRHLEVPHPVVETERMRQRHHGPTGGAFLLESCIELDNAIIDGHPGVTFGLHICRGNHKSMFYASGGYDRIAEQVFRRARFHRFLLEYDDARSGTFDPLRFVPDDRVVVLGLVSSKHAQLESRPELEQRVREASHYVPLERLAISPQCGFASTHEGNRLSVDDQRRKLQLVADTARAIWG